MTITDILRNIVFQFSFLSGIAPSKANCRFKRYIVSCNDLNKMTSLTRLYQHLGRKYRDINKRDKNDMPVFVVNLNECEFIEDI